MFTWFFGIVGYILLGAVIIGFLDRRNYRRTFPHATWPPEFDEWWPIIGMIIIWPVMVSLELGGLMHSFSEKKEGK